MIFSKRHYVWLASELRDELNHCKKYKDLETAQSYLCNFIQNLSSALKSENPEGFDEDLFHKNIFNPCEIQTSDKYYDWNGKELKTFEECKKQFK